MNSKFNNIGIFDDNRNVNIHNRMDWDTYFINLAYLIAKRSHDSQTMHGVILVKNNSILATGFNGFPAGSPDSMIPNIRPFKYAFINHAESSAIFDAARRGVSIEGCKAYITGHPCCNCCKSLISVGVLDWVIGDIGFKQTEQEESLTKFWLESFKVKITKFTGIISNK